MARLARTVIPGVPHHVTQRGNHRQAVFFGDEDYACYRDLIATAARRAGAEVWAWCLMPNHVHFIIPPPMRTACGRCSPRRTGATRGASMRG